MSDAAERIQRVRTQLKAFRELHAQELQLILDELADIAASIDEPAPPSAGPASSPKRAKWLAEQAERQQLSRRELLRGRERET